MTDGRLAYAEDLIRVSRQVVGVVLLSWQRILRVGLITAIVVLLVTEIAACLITSSFPPPPATHLVAVALACALGYGAAVTMLFGMILKGGITFIRYLEGDAELGVHAASVLARREADNVGAGVRRVFGGRSPASGSVAKSGDTRSRAAKKPRSASAAHGVATSAAVAAVGLDVARAATSRTKSTPLSSVALPRGAQSDVRRDPDDAIMRTPAPALQSLPVLASQMPRIGWTYDDNQPQVAPQPSTRSRPIQPIEQPTVAETMPAMADTIDTAGVHPPSPGAALPELSETTETPEAMEEPDAARGTPDVPGLIPRGWRYNSSATRPLPAVTRPLPKVTQPLPLSEPGASPASGDGRPGGLWKRVSQALVGQPDTPESVNGERADQPLPVSDALGDALSQIAPEDAWLIE